LGPQQVGTQQHSHQHAFVVHHRRLTDAVVGELLPAGQHRGLQRHRQHLVAHHVENPGQCVALRAAALHLHIGGDRAVRSGLCARGPTQVVAGVAGRRLAPHGRHGATARQCADAANLLHLIERAVEQATHHAVNREHGKPS
jgi:hypothetical protein